MHPKAPRQHRVLREVDGNSYTALGARNERRPEQGLPTGIFNAWADGKADLVGGLWFLRFSGNCDSPISLRANDADRTHATRNVRCRRCANCLSARKALWALRGVRESQKASRTWFGTLTLSPEAQEGYLLAARLASRDPLAPYWWEETCDERFVRVTDLVYRDVQKMWKRLRKAGHSFTYCVVFERHKSGLPHMHFLLHEQGQPILKRMIQAEWSAGFSSVKLVGAKRSHTPEAACWYVAKYLSKSMLARVRASVRYGR